MASVEDRRSVSMPSAPRCVAFQALPFSAADPGLPRDLYLVQRRARSRLGPGDKARRGKERKPQRNLREQVEEAELLYLSRALAQAFFSPVP